MRGLRVIRTFRLPILAGLFIGTSYIPFPPWAMFFCLTPLFIFWRLLLTPTSQEKKSPAWTAAMGGWLTQFILNLIGFHWIAHTAIEFGHFSIWLGLLSLIGFATIAHLYYPIAGLLGVVAIRRLKIDEKYSFAIFALIFALAEYTFPSIFPWHLGYPWLWIKLPGYQWADVVGFEGLNLFTIGINILVAHAVWNLIASPKRDLRRFGLWLASAAALVIVVNVSAIGRGDSWKRTDSVLNVLLVQGNIGNFDKLIQTQGRSFRDPIIQKFLELSESGLTAHPEADVMMWPETAYPDNLDPIFLNERNAVLLRGFLTNHGISLMTGAYSYDIHRRTSYNGFSILDAQGNEPQPAYRKTILLVFGETFPFSDVIPYMDWLFPDQGSFTRGSGPHVMNATFAHAGTSKSVRIGPQICYEGLYPWFSAELAKQNAQILTNVTNDSWFGNDFEPYQHLYMTLARAIEFRRPLVRSTNTGISTGILADGTVLDFSPQNREWTGLLPIKYLSDPPHTIYESIATLWPWVLALAILILLIAARGTKKGT